MIYNNQQSIELKRENTTKKNREPRRGISRLAYQILFLSVVFSFNIFNYILFIITHNNTKRCLKCV